MPGEKVVIIDQIVMKYFKLFFLLQASEEKIFQSFLFKTTTKAKHRPHKRKDAGNNEKKPACHSITLPLATLAWMEPSILL
jgi:hypothetical protein